MAENKTSRENDVDQFEGLVKMCIHRDGIDKLMDWIRDSDFYYAPASTRYHGAYTGGLLRHSLNVYSEIRKTWAVFGEEEAGLWDDVLESLAIVSLFHDVCKIWYYKTEKRWRKDSNNRWEQYATYKCDEDFHFGGHGAKSVYLIQHFMPLTPQEAAAINSHMGAWDASTYSRPSEVYESNRLAWVLHVADEAATYIDEAKDNSHE